MLLMDKPETKHNFWNKGVKKIIIVTSFLNDPLYAKLSFQEQRDSEPKQIATFEENAAKGTRCFGNNTDEQ